MGETPLALQSPQKYVTMFNSSSQFLLLSLIPHASQQGDHYMRNVRLEENNATIEDCNKFFGRLGGLPTILMPENY